MEEVKPKRKRGRPKGSKNAPKKKPIKKGGYNKKPYLSENEIENALWETGGFISQAAKRLGCTQGNVSNRVRVSERLKTALYEIQNQYLDFTESKLLKKIKQEDLGAICFYLKCKGKERGYVEHQKYEVTGEINQTGTIEHKHEIAIDESPGNIAAVLGILIKSGLVAGKLIEDSKREPKLIEGSHT